MGKLTSGRLWWSKRTVLACTVSRIRAPSGFIEKTHPKCTDHPRLSYSCSYTHTVWTLLQCQTPLHLWLHTQFECCYTVRHHFTRHYKYSLNAVRHRFTCHYTYSLNADRVRHHFTYGYTYSPNAFTLSRHHSPEVTHKFECCYRHHFTWGDISMLHCCH